MSDQQKSQRKVSYLRSIGPSIIVAAVVLGPGSILANSKVGWQYGYDIIWVVVGACILLIGMTAMSARLGVFLDGTLCEELASRAGRPIAVLTGISLFVIAGCFQFGNNLGVLYSMEPFLQGSSLENSRMFPAAVLLVINGGIVVALFGFRRLYQPVERLMKILVGLMVVGFAANLILARPSIMSILEGLLPQLPEQASETLLPRVVPGVHEGQPGIVDHLWPVQALLGTTFSVAGAFYYSYLVRQKGWTRDHLKRGLYDSIIGILTLCILSLMIMVTAAAVLHDNPDVKELKSAADVARQLQPFFGTWSTALFCMGIFAGAFSSFLVNAMIGGTIMSDGLGKGGSMDQLWPKLLTTVLLASGMVVAIGVKAAGLNTGNLIIFAQAMTVVGNPLLAGGMLWLACRPDLTAKRAVPPWMKILGSVGFVVVLVISIRTGYRLYLQII